MRAGKPGSARPVRESGGATAREIRRALHRADAGATLDAAELTALLEARGADLARLGSIAARVRDFGLEGAGRQGVVTYSRKVFVPLTHLCRDRCHYCTFATSPKRLAETGRAAYLSPDEVLTIAQRGAEAGCKEALFTLGDRPEDRWSAARDWLDAHGYEDTLSYVRAMAILILEETGLLPHLNPGIMSWAELQRLKPVAPSMGLMLESTATKLWSEPGGPHFGSPDKEPAVRLRTIEDAGRHAIPFTTGILVGIGEEPADRVDSLLAIRTLHRQYEHVQEVIVQNFRAKPETPMWNRPDADFDDYLATIAVARLAMGPRMRIQVPPNLSDHDQLIELLRFGADDWGGVSPLTIDHVNPERPWPHLERLRMATKQAGFELCERLTVHPEHLQRGEPWLDPRLRGHVQALVDSKTLLADPAAKPVGRTWQEPDGGLTLTGRTDLHASIDTLGRASERRSDFAEVYGDWGALRERAALIDSAQRGTPVPSDFADAMRVAERDPAALSDEQALVLMTAEDEALELLCAFADDLRREAVGEEVSFVVNRNINFTNVCYTGCRFCAFAQRRTDADAYTLSLEEVASRAVEAWDDGATEVCMQGGIHPDLPGTAYFDIIRAVKSAVPEIHVHAFSPMEVVNGASRTGLSIREWLVAAKEAGLDSIPGTAAEILDDEVRWILTKGKLPTDLWIEVVTTAHDIGLPSSSTMMYGHVDTPAHWVAHLKLLARLQETTGGFTEFVPLPFVHHNAPIYLAGIARPGPTVRDNRAVHAMARIILHGRIDNIQTSWVKLGLDAATDTLRGGANDLGGTLMEETISRMAGSQHGSRKSAGELIAFIGSIGRTPRQRTTDYGVLDREQRSYRGRPQLPLLPHTN